MMLREKVDLALEKILIFIMGVMVLNVLWQVFTRYLTSTPSSFTDELARYLMIWISILGAAYVSGKNMHVAIEVVAGKFKPTIQKKLKQLIYLLIIGFALFALIIGGTRLVYITYILGQHSAALQIPLAFVYSVLPISGFLIIYYKISDLKST